MPNIRVPSVPATRIIHMGGNGGNNLDYTGPLSCLLFEIVCLVISLVSHFGGQPVFLCSTHLDFHFLESAGPRFFFIYALGAIGGLFFPIEFVPSPPLTGPEVCATKALPILFLACVFTIC